MSGLTSLVEIKYIDSFIFTPGNLIESGHTQSLMGYMIYI